MNHYSRTAAFSSNVTPITLTLHRLIVQAPQYHWREPVMKRLEELMGLQRGWDGYDASAVTFENATFALRMLESVCDSKSKAPQIVPCLNGDLQIEWHLQAGDIELHVKAPNSVRAWRELPLQRIEEELDVTNDFSAVAIWVRDLMESNSDASAAAA